MKYVQQAFSYAQSALDYAYANYGRLAAVLMVLAPAAGLNLSNPQANLLAEGVLFTVFIGEEVVRILQKSSAPKAAAPAPQPPAQPAA